jgi:hypothetical protein
VARGLVDIGKAEAGFAIDDEGLVALYGAEIGEVGGQMRRGGGNHRKLLPVPLDRNRVEHRPIGSKRAKGAVHGKVQLGLHVTLSSPHPDAVLLRAFFGFACNLFPVPIRYPIGRV